MRTALAVNPHLYIGDMTGRPLDYGKVYFGEPNKDPEFYQIDVFYDENLTIPAVQPVRTKGGFLNANGDMVEIYAAEIEYSVKVFDRYGRQVFYNPVMRRTNTDNSITAQLNYAGAITRTLNEKNNDFVSIKDFGALGNDGVDDYAAIMNASKTGRPIFWSKGVYTVSRGMVFENKQHWASNGDVVIKYAAKSGSQIEPVLDFKDTIVAIGKFTVDHCADTGNYKDPVVYGGDIIAGSAVLVQGDDSVLENFEVINAWDNGISIIRLSANNKPVPGYPKYWNLGQIKTKNCGCGFHIGGMIPNSKVGGGIDVASGSMGVINSHIDEQSYTGFILDIGAGGQATVGSIVSIYPRCGENKNSTGIGVFIGSGDSCFNQITVIGSEGYPVWYDGTAQNCSGNIFAYNCQREILIKGSAASFDIRTKNTGLQSSNTVPAMLIDTTAGNLNELVINLLTTGEHHKYAVDVMGENQVDIIIKGSMTGKTAVFNNVAGKNIFTENHLQGSYALNRDYARGIFDLVGDFYIRDNMPNASYKADAFGDSTNNGTYFIEDANTNKRAAFGYDNVNDVFVIQAIEPNVSKKTVALNPSGGAVMIGKGDFTNPMLLGQYYLWVDASGNLRIKNGKPSADTDGVKVGQQ